MKKSLAEKTISELNGFSMEFHSIRNIRAKKKVGLYYGIKGNENFERETLKNWAIAIVKNCKNAWDEGMVKMLGKNDKINTPHFMCGYYHKGFKQKIYCQACIMLIEKFELKEEDLHENK